MHLRLKLLLLLLLVLLSLLLLHGMMDGMVVHALFHLLLLAFTGVNGTHQTASDSLLLLLLRSVTTTHAKQWCPCHASHLLLVPSRQLGRHFT